MASSDDQNTIALKQAAADAAVEQLRDGMVVGLGSGSTATLAVASIGKRVAQGLRIIGIPTSEKTAAQARELGIPLTTLREHPEIDVTIDGADEVDPALDLMKGGGGNQLREKIVATASARLIIVLDQRKVVPKLGTHFPIAIEVIRFGWETTSKRLTKLGGVPALRIRDGQPYITDDGNYILDCAWGEMAPAAQLQHQLDGITGLVEHGLFIGMASQVIVGAETGVRIIDRPQ